MPTGVAARGKRAPRGHRWYNGVLMTRAAAEAAYLRERSEKKAQRKLRKGNARMSNGAAFMAPITEEEIESTETDAEIEQRISARFETVHDLVVSCTKGYDRSLIISGPPGLGKSYTVEKALANWDPQQLNHVSISGYVKPTGLVKLLYQNRAKGKVLVFDDADSIFDDPVSLNLLKKVCDTTEKRRVAWLSEGSLYTDDDAEQVPRYFDFDGAVVFLTNIDFDREIARGNKTSEHLNAMVSRSHYIGLAIRTRRECLIRIKQVIKQGLLRSQGLTPDMERDVIAFLEKNSEKLREHSLRIAIKVGSLRKNNPLKWKTYAEVTCCR